MKLFKVHFIDKRTYPVYVVAKSFDDASEEVIFQINSMIAKSPKVEKIEIIADESGALSYTCQSSSPRLFIARSYDESVRRNE